MKLIDVKDVSQKGRHNITLRCSDSNEADKLEKLLIERYNNEIEIKKPEDQLPMLKITNVLTDIRDTLELETQIREQTATGTYTNLVVVSNIATQKMFIDRRKIILGLNSCPVHEYVNLIMCKNCCRYGHFARNCTFSTNCKKCAGNHQYEKCEEKTSNYQRCINCITNNKNGSKYNVRHRASDNKCPSRQMRIDALKGIHLGAPKN